MTTTVNEDNLNVEGNLDITSTGILNINNVSGAGLSVPSSSNTSFFYDTDTDLVSYLNTANASTVIGIDPANTINNIRHYGALASDPISPPPNAGDMYYNTTINHEMRYDASRGKWLSVAVFFEGCGRNGGNGSGTFYRRFNGMVTSATTGSIVATGTIISIGYTTDNATAHTLEVLVSGAVVATLASGGSNQAYEDTFNVDFSQGNMSYRNAGPNSTTNLQATVIYKVRSP